MTKRFSLLVDDDSQGVGYQSPLLEANNEQNSIPILKQIKFQQLNLQWPINSWRKYGVQIDFSEGDEKNEIKFETVITRLEDHSTGDRVVEINRSEDIWINEKEPDLVMDKLAHETGKVIYPLQLRVNALGEAIAIENHPAIVKRWTATKKNLSSYFEGEFFDKYIVKTEAVLFDLDRSTFAVLYRDWFMQSYFLPIFKNYGEDKTRWDYFKFPLPASFANPGFFTQQTIVEHTTDQGAIELIHQGELKEDEGLTIQKYKGNYEALIRLNPFHNHIVAYKGQWQFRERDKDMTVEIKYFELDNPALFSKNNWTIANQSQAAEPEKERQASFLKKLFD